MAGVPFPLQIGSPATTQPSADTVPSALRVGSPAAGTQGRPPLTRKNTSGGSDRLSQLFPSRPPSAASITPPSTTAHSRRTSLPSPLTPAAEPSYRIPRPPAPPSFAEDTSYNPTTTASHSVQSSSGKQRLLSRLTSLKSSNSRGGKYNRLDDEESGPGRRRLRGVEEEDEAVGFDLSGFDGMPMKSLSSQKRMASAVDGKEEERDMNEAGYAAEFERLEAQLGSGMSSVVERPFTHVPAQSTQMTSPNHRRVPSGSNMVMVQAQEAQKEAEKTERIVAVQEIPVDISDFTAGSDFDTRSIMTADTGLAKNEAETSYFFPEGKCQFIGLVGAILHIHRPSATILATIYDESTVAWSSHIHCIGTGRTARISLSAFNEKN